MVIHKVLFFFPTLSYETIVTIKKFKHKNKRWRANLAALCKERPWIWSSSIFLLLKNRKILDSARTLTVFSFLSQKPAKSTSWSFWCSLLPSPGRRQVAPSCCPAWPPAPRNQPSTGCWETSWLKRGKRLWSDSRFLWKQYRCSTIESCDQTEPHTF